jgi:hypothetical protein
VKKRRVIIGGAVLLLLVVAGSAVIFSLNRDHYRGNTNADGTHYSGASWAESYGNLEELSTAADLIAVGQVKGVLRVTGNVLGQATWGPISRYYTEFAFSVHRVLKGHGSEEEILIHQTGAEGKSEISDDPLLETGDKYIVFLREYEPGKYCILGGPQGRFQIINGQVFSMNHVSPDRVSFGPSFGVDVNGTEEQSFIDSVTAILRAQTSYPRVFLKSIARVFGIIFTSSSSVHIPSLYIPLASVGQV